METSLISRIYKLRELYRPLEKTYFSNCSENTLCKINPKYICYGNFNKSNTLVKNSLIIDVKINNYSKKPQPVKNPNIFCAKLCGYGDYQLDIFKIDKESNLINELIQEFYKNQENDIHGDIMGSRFVIDTDLQESTECLFENKFRFETFLYADNSTDADNPTEIKEIDAILKDECYNTIDSHDVMYNFIFSENPLNTMINYSIFYNDGNYKVICMEFENCYYLIDYDTS